MASQLETAMMQLRDLQRQIRKKELLEEQSRILDAIAEETKASREAEQSAVQYSAWLHQCTSAHTALTHGSTYQHRAPRC